MRQIKPHQPAVTLSKCSPRSTSGNHIIPLLVNPWPLPTAQRGFVQGGRRKNGGRHQGHWADLLTGSRSQAWVTHYHCKPTRATSLSPHFSPCSCRTQCGQGTPTPLKASWRPGSCSLVWSPEVSPLLVPSVPSLPPLAGADGLCDPGVARSQVWKIKGPFPSLPKWVKPHASHYPSTGTGSAG